MVTLLTHGTPITHHSILLLLFHHLLCHSSTSLHPPLSFVLFLAIYISTCFGCKKKYGKNLKPPADLCIRTQDFREFVSPNSGTMQTKFGNVYYHCTPECVRLRCSFFVPTELQVPPETAEQLTEAHKDHLTQFGLQL